jgi:hypothetical protein
MPKLIDLTGQRFHRLLVLERDNTKPPASNGRRVYWICQCDCGSIASKSGHELRSGNTRSCGCMHKAKIGSLNRTHGMSKTPTYRSWQAAKDRCNNPNNEKYPSYGGAGITFCPKWAASFELFLADMGERPEGHTLDRIEGSDGYHASNCRWATHKAQTENRPKAKKYFWNGALCSLSEIAKSHNIPKTSFNRAYNKTKDIKAAIELARSRMAR